MRDYGKVHSSFWMNAEIRALSDGSRQLALYLLTSPHGTQLGCFRLPNGYASEDLQWAPERVSEGFRELSRIGFATRDETSFWVLLPRFLKFNPVENPNQGTAAARLFEQIPDGPIKDKLAQALREFSPKFPAEVLNRYETLRKGFAEPFPNQEQEQEQEQYQEQEREQEQDSPRFALDTEPPPRPRRSPSKGKTDDSDARFDEFWAQVPKRDDKALARKEYLRIVKAGIATHAQLLAGIMRYAAERQGQDPSYTKKAHNWLKAGSWENAAAPKASGFPARNQPTLSPAIAALARHFDEDTNR